MRVLKLATCACLLSELEKASTNRAVGIRDGLSVVGTGDGTAIGVAKGVAVRTAVGSAGDGQQRQT